MHNVLTQVKLYKVKICVYCELIAAPGCGCDAIMYCSILMNLLLSCRPRINAHLIFGMQMPFFNRQVVNIMA